MYNVSLFEKTALKINACKEDILSPLVTKYWPHAITPNRITCFRFFLALIIIAICFDYPIWRWWILAIFTISMIADLLDGVVARTFNMISKTGGFIDPAADKLAIIPLLIVLTKNHPILMASLICLESILILLAIVAIIFKIKVFSNIWGKCKMHFEAYSIILMIILGENILSIFGLWSALALGIGSIVGRLSNCKK